MLEKSSWTYISPRIKIQYMYIHDSISKLSFFLCIVQFWSLLWTDWVICTMMWEMQLRIYCLVSCIPDLLLVWVVNKSYHWSGLSRVQPGWIEPKENGKKWDPAVKVFRSLLYLTYECICFTPKPIPRGDEVLETALSLLMVSEFDIIVSSWFEWRVSKDSRRSRKGDVRLDYLKCL